VAAVRAAGLRLPRLAVFVDGCFWHGCPRHYTKPANNRDFWRRKLEANRARDRRVNRELKRLGWRILRIWEHDLRLPKPRCTARLKRLLAAHLRVRRRNWRRDLPVPGHDGDS